MEDLDGKSVKQLRAILEKRGVDSSDCLEKGELIGRIKNTMHLERAVGQLTSQNITICSLKCTVVQNTTQPELVVVLSHGYGANADDLVSLAFELMQSTKLKNKPIKFIFPNAPIELDNGGLAWWHIDLQALMMRAMQGQILQIINEIPIGLDDARNKLIEMLKEIKSQTNLPWSKFVLGGFSQGAILSTDCCLHITEEAIGALGIFSGSMVSAPKWQQLLGQRHPGTKVLQSHGTKDMLLPYGLATYLKQFLEQHFTVDFIEFDGGHTIPESALKKFQQLLESF